MGYRLYVNKVDNDLCLGKLFGYVEEEKTKSFKFLVDNGYVNRLNIYFNYGNDNLILMLGEDFKCFYKLYQEDIKDFRGEILEDIDIDKDSFYILYWM